MTDTDERPITRRQIARSAVATGTVVLSPSFVQVSRAATSSGNVEVTTTSTQPTNTDISITVYEDTDGSGTANNQQSKSIAGGTDVVTEFDQLNATEASGDVLWMEINLSTNDDTLTPELDSATITLPSGDGSTATATATPGETQTPVDVDTEPQGFFEILDNYLFYVTAVIITFSGVGLASRSLAIASFGGYLTFAYIALATGTPILRNILYVTLVLIFIGFAFKFWRLEGMGE